MSKDLVETFFQRDLVEEEGRQLEALLSKDLGASQRFSELLAEAYAETGLPAPEPPAVRKRRRGLLWIGLAALLGCLGWGGLMLVGRACGSPAQGGLKEPEGSTSQASRQGQMEDRKPELLVMVDAEQGHAKGFKVLLKSADAGYAELHAFGAKGQLLARLHDGYLGKGSHSFEWLRQEPGVYMIKLSTRHGDQETWVEIQEEHGQR